MNTLLRSNTIRKYEKYNGGPLLVSMGNMNYKFMFIWIGLLYQTNFVLTFAFKILII